jgi:putative transposase
VVQRPSRAKGTGDEPFPIDPSIDLGAGSDELERAILESFRRSAVDVLGELWEEDVRRLCGERWKPRPRARFARAGWCGCQIVLGGDRVSLRRPRVRSNRGKELELPSFWAAASRDLLDRGAVEDITATITTGAFPPGRYPREPIAEQFVERLAGRMSAVHAMPRSGFEPGLLVAAVDFPDQTFLGAVGIDEKGERHLAGLRAGSPRSREAVDGFLEELLNRHRRSAPPLVFFVGEGPVIHESIRKRFGDDAALHRSPHEKRRRVLGLLPPRLQPTVLDSLLDAYEGTDPTTIGRRLREVLAELSTDHPAAREALSEGLEETFTMQRLASAASRPRRRKRSAHAST